jgi:glycosyltransferase involved in cell wall biosynthesis
MPISVMEAMAMGRPCLVSQLGDMPEWVKPGYNGYIVEGLSEERLAEQLEIAWNERESWDQLGKNAFMTFREKYPLPYEEKFIGLLNKHLCHT